MPTIKITGGEKHFVTNETAKKIRKIKYGEKGSLPAPANTPINLDGFGTVEVRDIRMILDKDDRPLTSIKKTYSEDEIKRLEMEVKKYKDFDEYCKARKFIWEDENGNIIVNRDMVAEYNEVQAKYREVRELRRKHKYAQEKNREGFQSGEYNF